MKLIDYNNYEGKFKDLSETPIEDALSYEDTLYYIGEDFEEYHSANRGEIVFVKLFMFSNGLIGNNHLFVILDKDNYSNFEYYGMLLSSQIKKEKYKYNYLIKKDKTNGLNKDSIIKTDYIYKLKGKNIIKKIGTINEKQIEKLEKMNMEWLNEKS